MEKYVIEKKSGNEDWEYASEVSAEKTNGRVDELIPGKTYKFRVKALNKAGESAPSDPSRTLFAKSRKSNIFFYFTQIILVPPKINRDMFNDIRIKKGTTIDFNVNVEGEPNPKNQWFINSTSLTTSNRTKIDNFTDNNTKLKTCDAERIDSGVYKLLATNEYGSDEAEVNVIVLGIFK